MPSQSTLPSDAGWNQQAHDIKNIIATVSMVADELIATSSPRRQVLGKRLERSCSRVLEICSADQIRFDKLGSSNQRSQLSDLLDDVIELARGLAQPNITFECSCDVVAFDDEIAAAIFRVVANLATNAVSAMNGRGGCLRIEGQVSNGAIVINVADDGPGLGAVTKRKPEDNLPRTSGMGLTIAQTLMERVGGSIDLMYSGAAGTCFRCQIPHNVKMC